MTWTRLSFSLSLSLSLVYRNHFNELRNRGVVPSFAVAKVLQISLTSQIFFELFFKIFSDFFATTCHPPLCARKKFPLFMLQNILFQHTPQLDDKFNSNFNRFLHCKSGVSCPFLRKTPKTSHPYGKSQHPTRRIYSRMRPNSATRSPNLSIKKPQNNNQRPKNSSPHEKNHNHPPAKSRKTSQLRGKTPDLPATSIKKNGHAIMRSHKFSLEKSLFFIL